MASQADVNQFAAAGRDLRAASARTVTDIWNNVDLDNLSAASSVLQETMPIVVAEFGDIAATVAADFYDEIRDQSTASQAYRTQLAAAAPSEQVAASTRWALGPMFSPEPDSPAALARLLQVADRMVLSQGDATIRRNVSSDPARPRWAWVPNGKTCAFCTLKASRGAVYHTSDTAAGGRHADCDCATVPIFPGDKYPQHYNPDDYRELYEQGRAAADGHSLHQILAGMREQTGLA